MRGFYQQEYGEVTHSGVSHDVGGWGRAVGGGSTGRAARAGGGEGGRRQARAAAKAA
ncbi:hypothetical protein GCM10010492_51210 [Saccharothrix mutabilis subsp. mutabilis]|uniref:Uncharacterized protein n=1 Tax=Saccharothrix mutabilis subsp. mutabilis TaxID=66855 RepID=A0ABN0UBZ6_9PSEU